LINEVNSMIDNFPDNIWTLRACKAVWSSWQKSGEDIQEELKYRIGIQILHPLRDEEIVSPQFTDVACEVSQAGSNANDLHPNASIAMESLRIARLLVAAFPQNAKILKLNSILETKGGDKAVALRHWRSLAARSKRGSLDWLEARFHVISSLAIQKPTDALALLDQHQALYPSYGVDPFGSQLRQLHLRLQGGTDES